MRITETNLQFKGGFAPRTVLNRIVVHHSASGDVSAATVHQWHLANGWAGMGYHYLIRANGTIERGRPENVRGAHAPEANADSLGICLAGNFELHRPTVMQMDALEWLAKDIWKRLGRVPVVGHKDVGATACPGKLFPWTELERRLRDTPAETAPPQEAGWQTGVKLVVNGRPTQVPLRIVSGRTEALLDGNWIQLRTLAALLGAAVNWDVKTQTVEFLIKGE